MRRRWTWIRALSVFAGGCTAGSLTGCSDEVGSSTESRPGLETPEIAATEDALEISVRVDVTDDTSIRVSAPNKNFGASPVLDVNRGLVKLTPAQLAAVVAPSDVLISARLELTLVDDDARRRQLPRQLGAHRVLQPWTELGATWLCAVDANPANARPDCAGAAAWQMQGSGAFVSAPTSTTIVPASRSGVVSLDVTADVRAFVSGAAANHGWLLKTPVGALLEIAELTSAESATPPRLVLQVRRCSLAECDDQNPCTADACDSAATCIHVPVEGLACDDGNACTQGDRCVAGACALGAPSPAGTSCGEGRVCDGSAAQCVAARVVVNEIESSGGTPGDWVELYNPGSMVVDVSGFRFIDNDPTHAFYVIPAGTSIPAGGFLVLDENTHFSFGLGGADSANLYPPSGTTPVASYAWTAHAPITYGRCPDGTGAFAPNATSTKGAANHCAPAQDGGSDAGAGADGGLTFGAWPGSSASASVDLAATFTGNLSGLTYQPASGAAPAVLWAVQNNPSLLYRLAWDGSHWLPVTSEGWSFGKALVYSNGLGGPDSEGVTKAFSDAAGIYVATERDNTVSGVSRLSILRFDTSAAGTTLTATHEWNLTSDLPAVGANLGLEAITWVPDLYLMVSGFIDMSTGAAYDPALYPDHGDGLFLVGVEASGTIYAYALDHGGSAFQRVATISSGQAGTMGLEFDRDRDTLWAYCDDTCGNRATLLSVDTAPGSPTRGQFVIRAAFERPSSLANINNEGIAIAPESECAAGLKNFYWSDDSDTGGRSLRQGSIPCAPLF